MKATGIVRKVDELGRIVLPIELRRVLHIDIKDPVEIFVDEDFIMLRKYQPALGLQNSISNLLSDVAMSKELMSAEEKEAAAELEAALEKFKAAAKK